MAQHPFFKKRSTISIYLRASVDGRQKYIKVDTRKPPKQSGTFHLRFEEDGKRFWQKVGPSLEDAIRLKAEYDIRQQCHKPLATAKPKVKPSDQRKTLAKQREGFLETKKLTRKKDGTPLDKETLSAYEQQTAEFLKVCKAHYADDVTGNDLRRYIAALEERGLSHRSICNHYTSIGSFLLHCKVDHKDLLPYGERPSADDGIPESYTEQEVQKFLSVISRERDLLFFEFLLKSGVRLREAATLEWTDLDLGQTPTVSIKARKPHLEFRNKTGKGRVIPLEGVLAAKLEIWHDKNKETKLVFGTRTDQEDGHWLEYCKDYAKKAGFKKDDWWIHKFRASFATWALQRGVDIRTVQGFLGHTSIQMTERYLAPGQGQRAQDAINAAFGGIALEQTLGMAAAG